MSTDTATAPTTDGWKIPVTQGGGDFEVIPPGNYPATICAVIDAGHHDANDPKSGRAYQRRSLLLCFELTKKARDGSPFVIGEKYTWSMSNNSNFYALAVNLTGPKREGEFFDPRTLAGMPVMVNITNTTSQPDKEGKTKTYHNVGTVARYPEGIPLPTRPSPPLILSVLERKPLPAELAGLPRIYGKTPTEMMLESAELRAAPAPAAADAGDAADDIPF